MRHDGAHGHGRTISSEGPPGARATEGPQQQVQYQDTPKKGQDCEKCLQFTPPDGCKLVAGKINPKGWCLLFAPKPK